MSTTFKESYSVLQRHAQTLRKQSDPNIDDFLSVVEESVAAYKVRQVRIDAVEKALEKALSGTQHQAAGGPGPGTQDKGKAPSANDDPPDDIPF